MGCRSDYLEPTPAETKARNAAQLILWLTEPGRSGKLLMKTQQRKFEEQANQAYAQEVGQTVALCRLIGDLRDARHRVDQHSLFDRIVQQNFKDPMARRLADWADAHDKQDQVNAAVEVSRKREADEDVITSALKGLSDDSLAKLKEIFANLK